MDGRCLLFAGTREAESPYSFRKLRAALQDRLLYIMRTTLYQRARLPAGFRPTSLQASPLAGDSTPLPSTA